MEIDIRRRTSQALFESLRRQTVLFELASRMQQAKTLGETYEAALEAIVKALRCDRASILLFDDAGVMRFVGWRHLSDN